MSTRAHILLSVALLLGACQAVDTGDLPTGAPSQTPASATATGESPTAAPTETLHAPTATLIPPNTPTASQEGEDLDGDGYFTPDDCDDTDGDIHPGVAERCDDVDQDCDGAVDEEETRTFYADEDGDGYGDAQVPVEACVPLAGTSTNGDDCDDSDADIHPFALEACDGVDQDCDESIDEGVLVDWYADEDGDGVGGDTAAIPSCDAPEGHVASTGDCDDADVKAFPGAPFEYQDGKDNDCDEAIDEVQLASTAAQTWTGDGDAWLGSGMAGAGDFDGDGFADLLLGEPLFDDARGRARLIYGPVNEQGGGSAVAFLEAETVLSAAGLAVAGGGDVNGDGYADIAVGQPARRTFSGRVSLVIGREDRLAAEQRLGDVGLTMDADFGINLGNSLAFADMDADGYDDLMIGAPTTEFLDGRAHLLFGRAGGDDIYSGNIDVRAFSLQLDGYTSARYFGYSMSAIGDFDGDGYADVAISAPDFILDFSDLFSGKKAAADDLCQGCGEVAIIYGGPEGSIGAPGRVGIIQGAQSEDGFGIGIGGVPDINGDHYDELLIGAPFFDGGQSGTGIVYLFYGGAERQGQSLTAGDADLTLTCGAEGCNLGHLYSVRGLGDVNGDALGDLFVGAVGGSFGPGGNTGIAGLILGRETLDGEMTIGQADVLFGGLTAGDNFGSVGYVGDLNSDGFGDLLMGAYRRDEGGVEAGQVYQFFGY